MSAAAKATVKPPCTAAGDVTTKFIVVVPAPVPSTTVGLLIVNVSAALAAYVILAELAAGVQTSALRSGVAAVTVPRVILKVSLGSRMASRVMFTLIVCVRSEERRVGKGLVVGSE